MFKTLLRVLLSVVAHTLPLIIFTYSWFLIPTMQSSIFSNPAPRAEMLVPGLVLGGYLIFQMFYSLKMSTGTAALMADSAIGIVLSWGYIGVGCYMAATQSTPWALVLPAIAAMGDALLSSIVSINNAAQKPLFERG